VSRRDGLAGRCLGAEVSQEVSRRDGLGGV
jgi:hypothetical protein